MTKTKQELKKELGEIEKKIKIIVKSFVDIKKKAQKIQKDAYSKKDNKKIIDLKNKIKSL
jgi:hypothetical protein